MHTSMTTYVKSLNKRSDGDGREKSTAIANLGASMSRHGEVFEDGNKFGECLIGFGQANERIARFQDTYASNATSSWLEALDRSLAQMKDYQNAKKKLDNRRSAYESTLAKIQKAKKEDYKAEEDLRAQRAKYEESTEDVYRRMRDIIESEGDNSIELHAFLEAELNYHDRCREALMQLKRVWPMAYVDFTYTSQDSTLISYSSTEQNLTRPPRSRTNTLSRVSTNNSARGSTHEDDEELAPPILPFRTSRAPSGTSSPLRELTGFDFSTRPTISRTNTAETLSLRLPARNPAVDAASLRAAAPLRPMKTRATGSAGGDVFGDNFVEEDFTSGSPDKFFGGYSNSNTRSSSPSTSVSQGTSGTALSRNTSYSTLDSAGQPVQNLTKKAPPPPPPPSRGTKPPPPPPPLKRSALSSSAVPYS